MKKAMFVQFSCSICDVKSKVIVVDNYSSGGGYPPDWVQVGDNDLVCGICLGKVMPAAEKAIAEVAKTLVSPTCDLSLAYSTFKRALDAAWYKIVVPADSIVAEEDLPE